MLNKLSASNTRNYLVQIPGVGNVPQPSYQIVSYLPKINQGPIYIPQIYVPQQGQQPPPIISRQPINYQIRQPIWSQQYQPPINYWYRPYQQPINFRQSPWYQQPYYQYRQPNVFQQVIRRPIYQQPISYQQPIYRQPLTFYRPQQQIMYQLPQRPLYQPRPTYQVQQPIQIPNYRPQLPTISRQPINYQIRQPIWNQQYQQPISYWYRQYQQPISYQQPIYRQPLTFYRPQQQIMYQLPLIQTRYYQPQFYNTPYYRPYQPQQMLSFNPPYSYYSRGFQPMNPQNLYQRPLYQQRSAHQAQQPIQIPNYRPQYPQRFPVTQMYQPQIQYRPQSYYPRMQQQLFRQPYPYFQIPQNFQFLQRPVSYQQR